MSYIPIVTLFSLLLLSHISHPANATPKSCHPQDEEALLSFRHHLSSHLKKSWKASEDCCSSWAGVECNEQGRVIRLEIHGQHGDAAAGTKRKLVSRELAAVDSGTSSNDMLYICNLTDITSLRVVMTGLRGPIPDCIGQLTNLTLIAISNNQNLRGPIPTTIVSLTNLADLGIDENPNLGGPIPTKIGQLRKLNSLIMNSNQLSGSIPDSIGNLSNVAQLFIYDNRLQGKIPETLGSLQAPNIEIRLENNKLSGTVPRSLKKLDGRLSTLVLSGNRLHGDPSFLLEMKGNLIFFDLKHNDFKFNLSRVQISSDINYLYIGNNRIYGSIPAKASQRRWSVFDVRSNRLCGPIPTGTLSTMEPENFENNKCLCGAPLPPC